MNGTTDWFDTERIAPETYMVTEGAPQLGCNLFLLGAAGEWLAIDAGLGIGDLRGHLEEIAGATPRLFLTHRHWDHIGAADQFEDVAICDIEQTGGTVRTDPTTGAGLHLPSSFVQNWQDAGRQFPDGFDPDAYEIPILQGVRPVSPGDTLAVGDRRLELLPIHGHSPGQLAALDRAAGIMFGGDIISPGGDVFTHLPGGDLEAHRASLARLIEYRDDGAFDTLATGHGDPRKREELGILDEIHAAVETVLAGEVEPEVGDEIWGDIHTYTVDGVNVLTRPA